MFILLFISVRAMHSVGGATLARRRLAVERHHRTLSHPNTNDHIYIDGHQAQETNLASETGLLESGLNYASLTAPTKSYLGSFSYEDLNSLRELCCSMEKKKEIR